MVLALPLQAFDYVFAKSNLVFQQQRYDLTDLQESELQYV